MHRSAFSSSICANAFRPVKSTQAVDCANLELLPVLSDKEQMSEQETGISLQAQAASPAWIRIERARHPQRPYPMDFIENIFTDFSEIHGDRAYGDDEAVACGMARLGRKRFWLSAIARAGQQKTGSGATLACPIPRATAKPCAA